MKDNRQFLSKFQVLTVGASAPIYLNFRTWDRNFQVVSNPNTPGNRKLPLANEFFIEEFGYCDVNHIRTDVLTGNLVLTATGNAGSYPALFVTNGLVVDSNVFNECLSKVFSKIRSDIDLSVDILEAGQTRRMIRDLEKVIRHVHRFRPRDLRAYYETFRKNGFKGTARGIGSKWLEFQYGWKPLAQDIYGAAIELEKFLPRLFVVKQRAHHVEKRAVSDTMNVQGTSVPYRGILNDSRRVEMSVHFEFKPSAIQFFSNFTSLNPVSMAWELTPYSFVVDWFLNVGGYLRNLETACLLGQQFRSGYVTHGSAISVDVDRSISVQIVSGDRIYTELTNGFNRLNWKKRVVLGSLPFPLLPRFQANLGSGRLLNAASLLSQHLRS